MNLVTLISVILLCALVLEWLLAGFERIQRDVFNLVFCVVALLFTAKYYYGPDITTYVPLYDMLANFDNPASRAMASHFEKGYMVFYLLCHAFGLSFWGMSAVVSLLIFAALYMLIRRLRYGRVMALALIVILNPDLLYAQFRQCLAVSFFIFAVLLVDKRKYLEALVLACIAMTMHKSALFLIVPAFLYFSIQPKRMEMSSLGTMLMVLCLLAIIPTQGLVETVVEKLVGDGNTAKSIRTHIAFSNLRQSNLLIYCAALVSLLSFSHGKRGRSAVLVAAMIALILTVVFYQYYLLVNRLRAYFLPFAVVMIIEAGTEAREQNLPWNALVRQSCKLLVLVFLMYKTYSFNAHSAKDGDVLEMSTVFELATHSKSELRDRQMEKAQSYWDNAFLKGDDLEHRSKNYVDQYKDDQTFSKNKKKNKK